RSLSVAAKEPVWVAGSTSAPEERVVLGAYRELRSRFPELRLVLVPRHKERFDEVARLIAAEGFALRRRSDGCESDAPADAVRLLDTLGELSACWGLADVAFVGGSLPGTGRGGQNMIEPAARGLPVLVGPAGRHFKAVVAMLREADAIETVTAETLAAAVGRLLTDRDGAEAMGRRAAGVVRSGLGATERTATLVEGYLQAAASSRAA
ncbi:MAG: 3-deoxy-D-manno-octulosonic acid transferase, partial [Planctomycetota bacterium]